MSATDDNLNFSAIGWDERPQNATIKIIGVGGGGGNAVNHMLEENVPGVEFILCNTDSQDLAKSRVETKIKLGKSPKGLGAGCDPIIGAAAAEESTEEIKQLLGSDTTEMVFITAGMGGGTGTGASPIIAKIAKDLGILTVGVVTMPFKLEGSKKTKIAIEGVKKLKEVVDALIIISNDRIRDLGGNLGLKAAFKMADNILLNAARSITDFIVFGGHLNVDFNDIRSAMKNSGIAVMGRGESCGKDRLKTAIEQAINSPLLNNNDIRDAKRVLLNITHGTDDIALDEVENIDAYINKEETPRTFFKLGIREDTSLDPNEIQVTIIATDFDECFVDPQLIVEGHTNHSDSVTPTPSMPQSITIAQNTAMHSSTPQPIQQIQSNNTSSGEIYLRPSDSSSDYGYHTSPQVIANQTGAAHMKQETKQLTEQEISVLENVPAYLRKQQKMAQMATNPAAAQVSNYTLTNSPGPQTITIRDNNAFLHDNVD